MYKKLLFPFLFLLFSGLQTSTAQPFLYGLTSQGGNGGGGALVKLDVSSNTLATGYSWEVPGRYPQYTSLVEAPNGKLYGMTSAGGSNGYGTIFSFDPITNTHVKLFDFNNANGSYPNGSLVVSGGKLYGMTSSGGNSSGNGTIFSFDPATNTHVKLFDFNITNGSYPNGSLVVNEGKLYGMTYTGGSSGYGTIFSFDPATNTHNKFFDFNKTIGSFPSGSLVVNGGKLYGMTSDGGNSGLGTIFSFNPATNTHTKLFDFNNTIGSIPDGSLIVNGGKLYGMTTFGGSSNLGTIFSFDPVTNSHSKLLEFDYNTQIGRPKGSMVVSGGKLYGITSSGGISGDGTIFSFDPATNTCSKLFEFNNTNGSYPQGSLVVSDGKLFGMTTSGGISAYGTIFSFDPATNTHVKLFDFNNKIGSSPKGSLVVSGGKLYGMTSSGGISGYGTIFSFDPTTNTHVKLFDFNYSNGANPYGSLVLVEGKLYGMTYEGGSNNSGTIFSFDPATNTHVKLFDFNYSNGANPYGSLVLADRKLYGMTYRGGGVDKGTIFSFDLLTNTHIKFFDFGFTSESAPYGSLVLADGILYGMSNQGGSSGYGTIFSINPLTNTYNKLFDFTETKGGSPYGNLVVADNKLYGITHYGGISNYGTIFSFDLLAHTHDKLFDFNNVNGGRSNGSLVQASNGKLFGMTYQGGLSGYGTIFSFDPSTNTHAKLQDFNFTNGAYPFYGAMVEYNPEPTPASINITSPANNSSYSSGSSITVNVNATNPFGSISYIDFFERGTKLGTDSSTNYSFTANAVPAGNYRVSAIAITNLGDTLRSDTVTVNVVACTPAGTIYGEGYTNITGAAVADLTSHPTYPNGPSIVAQLAGFEYASIGDNYGGRLRGYLCVPQTGEYTFYISGDDQVGLWLSTDDNPSNKQLIAYTSTYSGFREWNKFPTQQSIPINMVAGTRYYVETLHKESAGSDHLSVGWKLPNGTLERPIPASRLSPFQPGGGITPQAVPQSFEQEMRTALNNKLTVRAMPNPSRANFTINLQGKEGNSVRLTVTNILGRVIENRANLQPNSILQLGQNWNAGIYLLQVQQGEERKTIKLIKE